MLNLTALLTFIGVNSNVKSFAGTETPGEIVMVLGDGATLTFTPKPVETQYVAYFGYPDSDGIGSYSSRRVILKGNGMAEKTFRGNPCYRGWETSDNHNFKSFLINKMRSLRIVQEPLTDEDRKLIGSL